MACLEQGAWPKTTEFRHQCRQKCYIMMSVCKFSRLIPVMGLYFPSISKDVLISTLYHNFPLSICIPTPRPHFKDKGFGLNKGIANVFSTCVLFVKEKSANLLMTWKLAPSNQVHSKKHFTLLCSQEHSIIAKLSAFLYDLRNTIKS